jgi:lipopolysaccharide/colanic/teichoic acid biosynthesis glycosyltransferase
MRAFDAGATAIRGGEAIDAAPATSRARGTDVACRALDILLSAAALAVLTPLLIAIAVGVRLDSSGPVIFRQRRLGHRLRPFTVNKFRTMRHGADHERHRAFVLTLMAGHEPPSGRRGPRFKLSDDDRVTRFGAILRRTSLDELPQLWNVLRGEMSMVGPRPTIPYEVEHFPSDWFIRFGVKPGITGLWQVSGRCELTYAEMVQLDGEYVDRRSLWLNLWILICTVPVVLSTRGAG